MDAPIEPDFVFRSAKYVDRTYEAIDSKYHLDIETKMPLEYFVDEFDKLPADEDST